MPFVLAPNLWSKITKHSNRQIQRQERSHGDGLLIDYDSPEALEEVFWRTFDGKRYIQSDGLHPYRSSEDTLRKYRQYVSLILKKNQGTRYLAKNNNGVLRIKSILEAFPDAIILIPFRDPYDQSVSLLTQHQRFSEVHHTDPFSLKYMNWLTHHEFGNNHLPIKVNGNTKSSHNPNEINYWVEQWVSVYRYLLAVTKQYPKNCYLFNYESFCNDTDQVWKNLIDLIEIDGENLLTESIRPKKHHERELGGEQWLDAKTVYEELNDSFVQCFSQLHSAQNSA